MIHLINSATRWHIYRRDVAIAADLKKIGLNHDVSSVISEYVTIGIEIIEKNMISIKENKTVYTYKSDEISIEFSNTIDPYNSFAQPCMAKCYMFNPHIHAHVETEFENIDQICYYIDIFKCIETGDSSELIKLMINDLSEFEHPDGWIKIYKSVIGDCMDGYIDSLIW